MFDRRRLGDHPAHRRADQVSAVESEGVEQPDGVGGHVRQPVGRRRRVAEQRRAHIGHGRIRQVGRQADVAVVEADHVQATGRERGAEPVRPAEHLRAEAHHAAAPPATRDRRTARRRCRCARGRRRGRSRRSPSPPQDPVPLPVLEPVRAVGPAIARAAAVTDVAAIATPALGQRTLERRRRRRSRSAPRRRRSRAPPDGCRESHPRQDRVAGRESARTPLAPSATRNAKNSFAAGGPHLQTAIRPFGRVPRARPRAERSLGIERVLHGVERRDDVERGVGPRQALHQPQPEVAARDALPAPRRSRRAPHRRRARSPRVGREGAEGSVSAAEIEQ